MAKKIGDITIKLDASGCVNIFQQYNNTMSECKEDLVIVSRDQLKELIAELTSLAEKKTE